MGAERRVLEAFSENIKISTIPLPPALGGEERERLVEIVVKWNSSHSFKCVLAHPILEESGERWSDAELAAQNPITALQIERNVDNWPCRIRARYGPDWA